MSEESKITVNDLDEPRELFVLDLIHSGGVLPSHDFRVIPVDANTPEPDEVIDPKASSALESVESSESSEPVKTEENPSVSSASQVPFASAEKVSSPPKEVGQTGSPTS